MDRGLITFIISVLLFSAVTARAGTTLPNENNVIFITIDGVRWQEVFRGPEADLANGDSAPTFPYLLGKLAPQGVLFGNVDNNNPMYVSNSVKVSLPAYMSMFGGKTTGCLTNECDPIDFETFPERLVREARIPVDQVVTFASWDRIARAVEHVPNATTVNVSINAFNDSIHDAELDRINAEQAQETPPWDDARFDKFTWALGMRYLKLHRPRFLYISLDDSDEWGHKDEYGNYLNTLRTYDGWLKELDETLKGMGDYGKNTTIIVTTDHGRGDGTSWTDHGPFWPEAKYIWLYARSSQTHGQAQDTPAQPYSHLDIRPTIEKILGLDPQSCSECGTTLHEVVR